MNPIYATNAINATLGWNMRIITILLIITLSSIGFADDGFKEFLSQEKQGFEEFKSQADKEFYDYLKTCWEEFKAFSALKRDEKPKITKPPVAKREDKKIEAEKQTKIVSNIQILDNKDENAVKSENVNKRDELKNVSISKTNDFYSLGLKLEGFKKPIPIDTPLNGKKIAEAWKFFATNSYEPLVEGVSNKGKMSGFDDWGYFKFVKLISEEIYKDYNSKILLAWYILSKLGYDVKIGYNQDYVYLLVPAKQQIYGSAFFTFNNLRYYILWSNGKEIKNLYSYSGKYPDAQNVFSFKIEKINGDSILSRRDVQFVYDGKRYSFPIYYDSFTVDFYKDFPQTDLSVYYRADVSYKVVESIVEGLKNAIVGKSEAEAVNLILRFVQTAFQYKTDQEQFGYEKYLLPDETVYYPYSDCEDRSIMFAYLVRKILGLEVVLLEYPGHVATGVRFTTEVGGDRLRYGDKIYVVCDPTYINANIGMAMPQFKNVVPKIIF